MRNIAIITARGGSKRIPRKNIKDFLGKPILSYSIEAALKSNLFEEVMVSTDDDEIAEISKQYGARVPFKRSPQNSDDHATTADVLLEVINWYKDNEQREFDALCCLYPTTPFITPTILKNSLEKMNEGNFDSLFPIVEYPVPIQIALQRNPSGSVHLLNPDYALVRTQDMEHTYYDPGQFYWIKTPPFCAQKKVFFETSTGSFLISHLECQDIDNLNDWALAELKYKLLHQNS